MTTDEVYDASPAALSSHAKSRRDFAKIIDGYLVNDIDILLGGGRGGFLPKSAKGSAREDERDLIAEFKAKGYAYVANREELRKVDSPRVLGLFAGKAMPFDLDRNPASDPSVFDMMEAALRVLPRQSPNGFLLFLETENTDEGNHDSDVASFLAAIRELDRAVALAYEFYTRHPQETLILVLSDHETGGFSLTYAQGKLDSKDRKDRIYPGGAHLAAIQKIACSAKRAGQLMGKDPSNADIDRVLARCYPGFEMPERYRQWILKDELPGPNYLHLRENALGLMVALKTQVYYGTEGHSAQPVFLAALGVGAERFRGYMDNTDIGKALLDLLR
jgi:alkaline phosphatase